MVWLDRIGLILQFVSAFLIAPELIGEERLNRILKSVTLSQQLTVYVPLAIGLTLIAWAVAFRELAEHLHRVHAAAIVSLVALGAAAAVVLAIRRHVAQRLVEALTDREALRKRLLSVGAVLFTAGFVLQFAATFHL